MGVRWLMKQAVRGLWGSERKLTSLSEPERAPELRICQVWSGAGRRDRAETGGLIKGLSMKPEQLAPLLHFSSPGQEPEPHLRRKAMNHMGRSKVSVVHLGTLQVSLHCSGLWGTAASQLASCMLTVALEWSLPMSKHADVSSARVNAAKEARRQMKSVSIIMFVYCLWSPHIITSAYISMFLSSFWLFIEYLSAMWQIFHKWKQILFSRVIHFW